MKYLISAIENSKAGYWDLVWYDDESDEITYKTIWEKGDEE